MDKHGRVLVEQLIERINSRQKYNFNTDILDEIVVTVTKQRYRYNEKKVKYKVC